MNVGNKPYRASSPLLLILVATICFQCSGPRVLRSCDTINIQDKQLRQRIQDTLGILILNDPDFMECDKNWKVVHFDCYFNDIVNEALVEVKISTGGNNYLYYYLDPTLDVKLRTRALYVY
ncbi:MAG: hypothetical protein H6608_04755 [Flavobacteriales bacterium]|nr:hypothetical protein [Bacteroidota bacterium]MCB9240413.1 hypothetical protein [Flavobacteriales bacterium]